MSELNPIELSLSMSRDQLLDSLAIPPDTIYYDALDKCYYRYEDTWRKGEWKPVDPVTGEYITQPEQLVLF